MENFNKKYPLFRVFIFEHLRRDSFFNVFFKPLVEQINFHSAHQLVFDVMSFIKYHKIPFGEMPHIIEFKKCIIVIHQGYVAVYSICFLLPVITFIQRFEIVWEPSIIFKCKMSFITFLFGHAEITGKFL